GDVFFGVDLEQAGAQYANDQRCLRHADCQPSQYEMREAAEESIELARDQGINNEKPGRPRHHEAWVYRSSERQELQCHTKRQQQQDTPEEFWDRLADGG